MLPEEKQPINSSVSQGTMPPVSRKTFKNEDVSPESNSSKYSSPLEIDYNDDTTKPKKMKKEYNMPNLVHG